MCERLVEYFDDGHSCFGWTLVFEVHEYMVNFEAHEIQGRGGTAGGGAPFYDIFDWHTSGDWTEDLEAACPQVRGHIKWDACGHAHFGNAVSKSAEADGYLHLCGQESWLALSKVLVRVYERCMELQKHKDGAA